MILLIEQNTVITQHIKAPKIYIYCIRKNIMHISSKTLHHNVEVRQKCVICSSFYSEVHLRCQSWNMTGSDVESTCETFISSSHYCFDIMDKAKQQINDPQNEKK